MKSVLFFPTRTVTAKMAFEEFSKLNNNKKSGGGGGVYPEANIKG